MLSLDMKTRPLKDAPEVPGMPNLKHGDAGAAFKSAKTYIRTHPDLRNDQEFRSYINLKGRPVPDSVRIRDLKERIAALKRAGRVS